MLFQVHLHLIRLRQSLSGLPKLFTSFITFYIIIHWKATFSKYHREYFYNNFDLPLYSSTDLKPQSCRKHLSNIKMTLKLILEFMVKVVTLNPTHSKSESADIFLHQLNSEIEMIEYTSGICM